jgi:hypothetical protein
MYQPNVLLLCFLAGILHNNSLRHGEIFFKLLRYYFFQNEEPDLVIGADTVVVILYKILLD